MPDLAYLATIVVGISTSEDTACLLLYPQIIAEIQDKGFRSEK